MKTSGVGLLLAAFLSTCLGQWQIETVDSSAVTGIYPFATLAVDAAGVPHIAYMHNESVRSDLYYASRVGQQWSLEMVDSVAYEHSDLALGRDGIPHIMYVQYGTPGPRYACLRDSWEFELVANDSMVWFLSAAIDSAGSPCVAYAAHESLKFGRRTGPGTWSVETVDPTASPAAVSLRMDSHGEPCIAYYSYDRGQLWYARHESGTWSLEAIDTVGGTRRGVCASLALDSSDRAHIAYGEYSTYLKHAWQEGSTWGTETVDSIGYMQYWQRCLDIELDGQGRPCISYFDRPEMSFRFAVKVGGQWRTELVRVDSSGWCTSLVISGDTIHLACAGKTLVYATREVGIEDSQSDVNFGPAGRATIVTGTLNVPYTGRRGRAGACVLVAANGRRAATLNVGPNDVRSLTPGVYFLLPTHATGPLVTKLVVAR
jgi:hypothetical protein